MRSYFEEYKYVLKKHNCMASQRRQIGGIL